MTVRDFDLDGDMAEFANKMIIQKMAIELLPNDTICLGELLILYSEVISFNDNIYLRILAWRRELCAANGHPPDLLKLEETLSIKILTIYNHTNEGELFNYSISFFRRFS